jgi:acetoin utilization protein AcuB
MKQMPLIQKFMSVMPHTVSFDLPLTGAISLMREQKIRHLPVMNGEKLVGVLTDRDVKLVSGFAGSDTMRVEQAMIPEPYVVTPDASLDHVVSEMAEHRYGCAVIRQENGKVVGIFTATDGLRVLSEQLGGFYKAAQESPLHRTHS